MASILKEKSYKFAVRIVKLVQHLQNEKKEFVMSKQLLKAGTSVGAMNSEAEFAQSKADFINKISVGLKEANETKFWLSLLKETDYIEVKLFESFIADCEELIRMMVASVKTCKQNSNSIFHSSLFTLH